MLQLPLPGPQDGYFSWSLALLARIAAVEAPTVAGMATENRKLLLEPSLIDLPSIEAARAIATQFDGRPRGQRQEQRSVAHRADRADGGVGCQVDTFAAGPL